MDERNTWSARLKRTLNSTLPVSKDRAGRCISCGACCNLPHRCPFLRYKKNGESYCRIYLIRPLNCRKYPRSKDEFITEKSCGYRFM